MLNDSFEILGKEIPKGSKAVVDLKVAKLHTRTTVNIPVIIERSRKPGPVLLLIAGIHGDEVNGVGIIREIIEQKINKPKKGTVICIPVFNVFGYLIQTREFPDGRDLNRMFPGSETGSLASQFAYQFTKKIAPKVDYVIDFHTGGADRNNAPQVRCHLDEAETVTLAHVFGAPYLIHSNYIAKSLRETLRKMGKTVLLFEGGKSKELDPDIIQYGVQGTKNVMMYLGMHKGNVDTSKQSKIIKKSKWIRAAHSGMLKLSVSNSSFVQKKEILGVIQDPFGEFKRNIYAPFNCYVFCVNTSPIVNKGDAIFHVSIES
jgi:predicted deacylase